MKFKVTMKDPDTLGDAALFTMANDLYVKACGFGLALNRMIMVTPEKYPGGHVDDAIYSDERQTVEGFDEALRREGIKVLQE